MAIKTFIKGSTTYLCLQCGINTRITGDRSAESCGLCNECYELAGIENGVRDGEEVTPNLIAEINHMLTIIAKKGGDSERAFDKSLLEDAMIKFGRKLPEGVTQQMVDDAGGAFPIA